MTDTPLSLSGCLGIPLIRITRLFCLFVGPPFLSFLLTLHPSLSPSTAAFFSLPSVSPSYPSLGLEFRGVWAFIAVTSGADVMTLGVQGNE